MKHVLVLASLALVAAGCRTPNTPFPEAQIAGLAPIPYTAEEIRANHPSGSMTHLEIVRGGEVVEVVHTEFLDADALSVTLRMSRFDAAGAPLGEPAEQRATWEELRGHAHFAAAATELGHSLVEVPAGEFECWVYRVHAGDEADTVVTYHFAVDEPGPPVLFVEERGGVETGRWRMSFDNRR
jgi:hypothetical protein